jgi:hypothetical protein
MNQKGNVLDHVNALKVTGCCEIHTKKAEQNIFIGEPKSVLSLSRLILLRSCRALNVGASLTGDLNYILPYYES